MMPFKVHLKGTKESDPQYDMTITDRRVMDGKEKARCEYVVTTPEGEIGLHPNKIPLTQTDHDWFLVSELEVTVYQFTCYDIKTL